MLRAWGSASCDSTYETGGTLCYGHWVLHLVIADTLQGVRLVTGHWVLLLVISRTKHGYDLLRAMGSASYDSRHETGGTICYGHWVLHLVLADTRQGVRFVTGIGFCILC